MNNNKFVGAVLVPVFVCIITFMLFPLFLGLGVMLYDYNPLKAENPFVGLGNLKRLFTDSVFHTGLKNTMFFVFITVGLNICITLVVAELICSLRNNWQRGFLRVVFFMPCVAPLVRNQV